MPLLRSSAISWKIACKLVSSALVSLMLGLGVFSRMCWRSLIAAVLKACTLKLVRHHHPFLRVSSFVSVVDGAWLWTKRRMGEGGDRLVVNITGRKPHVPALWLSESAW
jgi:hypothetical protein